jgi:hypothetical protein
MRARWRASRCDRGWLRIASTAFGKTASRPLAGALPRCAPLAHRDRRSDPPPPALSISHPQHPTSRAGKLYASSNRPESHRLSHLSTGNPQALSTVYPLLSFMLHCFCLARLKHSAQLSRHRKRSQDRARGAMAEGAGTGWQVSHDADRSGKKPGADTEGKRSSDHGPELTVKRCRGSQWLARGKATASVRKDRGNWAGKPGNGRNGSGRHQTAPQGATQGPRPST